MSKLLAGGVHVCLHTFFLTVAGTIFLSHVCRWFVRFHRKHTNLGGSRTVTAWLSSAHHNPDSLSLQLVIRVHLSDESSKTMMVDERQTVRQVSEVSDTSPRIDVSYGWNIPAVSRKFCSSSGKPNDCSHSCDAGITFNSLHWPQ